MILETDRLLLKPLSSEFTQDMFKYFTNVVTVYMSSVPTKCVEDTQKVVDMFVKGRENGTDYVYAIVLKDTNEFLGCVGLHGVKKDNTEPGIWIKKDAHGNGYGKEAFSKILDLSKDLGLTKLLYRADKNNIGSIYIPEYYNANKLDRIDYIDTVDDRKLELLVYEFDLK